MTVAINQGSQKVLTFRFRDAFDNPVDLTNYTVLRFCTPNQDGSELDKKRVIITGTIGLTSPIVTATDTSNLAIGDLVAGSNIPLGTKVLTIDSPTQFTMDHNATLATTETLTIGDVFFNGNSLLGAVSITLFAADTNKLPVDQPLTFECRTVVGGVPDAVTFANALVVNSLNC